jgi:hypothetical protein
MHTFLRMSLFLPQRTVNYINRKMDKIQILPDSHEMLPNLAEGQKEVPMRAKMLVL